MRRLDSWQDIAEYLGREVRTVQFWEKNAGLPIHREWTTTYGPMPMQPSWTPGCNNTLRRPLSAPSGGFLFRGRNRGTPLSDIENPHKRALAASGLALAVYALRAHVRHPI